MFDKKILKVVSTLVLAVTLCGCSPIQGKNRAEDVRQVADKIAGYQLPAGYTEQFSVDMLGYQLVSLEGPMPSCHIYLVQAPQDADIDLEKLQEKARTLEVSRTAPAADIRIVETRDGIINGQSVTLLIGEGSNSENQTYREVTALFEGRNGPALVSMGATTNLWDWDLVDSFLSSIE
jgi:hypothetical protein